MKITQQLLKPEKVTSFRLILQKHVFGIPGGHIHWNEMEKET